MLVNGIFELAGVTGILPLMVAATDPNAPKENELVGWLYGQYAFDSYTQFWPVDSARTSDTTCPSRS